MQGTYVCPLKMNLQSSGFLLKHIFGCGIRNAVEIYKEVLIKSRNFSCAVLGSMTFMVIVFVTFLDLWYQSNGS